MNNLNQRIFFLIFFTLSILFIGCGMRPVLTIRSEPTGAKIYDERGNFIGLAPTNLIYFKEIPDEVVDDGEWTPGITYIAYLDGYKESRWYCRFNFNPQKVKDNKSKGSRTDEYYTYTFKLEPLKPIIIEEAPKVQIQQQQQQQQQNVIIGNPNDIIGSVFITTLPEYSDLYVDGLFVGNAPATLKLKEGIHIIEAKSKGFIDYKKEIRILSNSDLRIRIELEKK